MTEVLRAQGITKWFGKRTVLQGLDLSLEKGRIYGLIGVNGAGKTTLMRILAGLCLPTEGSLSLLGEAGEAGLCAARRRTGFLIETPIAGETSSVGAYLSRQAGLLGRDGREDLKELRKRLGITERQVGRGRYALCSLGQKQRYGLAAALLGKPELLVLDEPMNGLDPAGFREVRELLQQRNREQGVTMLISSHLLEELRRLATDYLFLHEGRLLEHLSAEKMEKRLEEEGLERLEDWYLRRIGPEGREGNAATDGL